MNWGVGGVRDMKYTHSVTSRLQRAIVVVDLVLRDCDCDRDYGCGCVRDYWQVSPLHRRPWLGDA